MDAKRRCARMSLSSVSVAANALRFGARRYKDDQRVISAMIKAGGIAPRA